MLIQGFKDLLDPKYTSGMEGNLDRVEEGKLTFKKAMTDFWGPFSKALVAAGQDMQNLKAGVATGEKCPECGELAVRPILYGMPTPSAFDAPTPGTSKRWTSPRTRRSARSAAPRP